VSCRQCYLLRCIGRDWHVADKPTAFAFVAYWTNNGQVTTLGLNKYAANDPMYGPAVRRKWISPNWR
jgi:hypothetical protein